MCCVTSGGESPAGGEELDHILYPRHYLILRARLIHATTEECPRAIAQSLCSATENSLMSSSL